MSFGEVTTQIWSGELFRGLSGRQENVPRPIRKTLCASWVIWKTLCTSRATCFTKLLVDVEVSIQVEDPFLVKTCACSNVERVDVHLQRSGSFEKDIRGLKRQWRWRSGMVPVEMADCGCVITGGAPVLATVGGCIRYLTTSGSFRRRSRGFQRNRGFLYQ